MTEKVTLDQTDYWKLDSKCMEYVFDIKVSFPNTEPPEEGFPTIYMLDGNSHFQYGRDVVRLQSRNAPKTFVAPAIVVGIGHHGTEKEVSKQRFHDFTPFAEQYSYPDRLKAVGGELGPHGGADKLLDFMEQELMPEIARRYVVDPDSRTLFGHSLGGLFVLYTLLTRSHLFTNYLACSPSIWWNDHEILEYEKNFRENTDMDTPKNLFIAVGEEEGFMVNDAKDLVSNMESKKSDELQIAFYIAPEENHGSVVPTIMSRAIRFSNGIFPNSEVRTRQTQR
ncbi:alpha/beta hydrolase [Sporosarcina aquimarina]|uniref:Alpha/beta hydrolase-fold protein n=1 Tax=Sporosarcina aquimarina TaxID=114975 RepID=A0ABU4G0R5_9BACL|nr:alpha/beta hydrolase-fold protein [Sporosarcina aquimarina]MDW0110555.1 alpha/beta hydrolase-fold protein [Sporosarcina aquimarina]